MAFAQQLGGCLQLVSLTLDLTEPDIHVCGPVGGSATLFARDAQCLLVNTRRIAETTLRDPYVRQCDGAANSCRQVPAALHIRHTLGVASVGRLQIATRPG